jgi:iron(III) transport system substrate-binding protein
LLAVASSAGAPVAHAETIPSLVTAARQEGELDLITPLYGGQPEMSAWIAGFTKLYGFDPNVKNTPTTDIPAVASKVAQESQAGHAGTLDVFIGSETHLLSLTQADVLQMIDWSYAPNIKPDFAQDEGRAVAIMTRLPGITYNASRVRPTDVPRTLEEFVATKYSIATTPYGANLNILASPEVWGEAKTLDFVKRLSTKAAGLINCGQANRLLTGEFDIFGMDCGNNEALGAAAHGAPLKSAIMSDAAILSYLYMSIPKNAPHPASAKLWINYILSRDAQDAMYKYDFSDFHRIAGSHTADDVATAEAAGAKFIAVDYGFALRNAKDTQRLRQEFQSDLQK